MKTNSHLPLHVVSVFVMLVSSCLVLACQKQPQSPTIASSAESGEYALRYPDALDGSSRRFDTLAKEAQDNTSTLPQYPAQTEIKDKAFCADVLEAASLEGRSEAYVAAAEQDEAVRLFFEEEQGELTRRVSGSVQSALAKQNSQAKAEPAADSPVPGAVSYGLKEGVKKRLEKRLRERSDAAVLIESRKEMLGKKGAEALQLQADTVARTSYLIEVALPQERLELLELAAEVRDVEGTLEDQIKAEDERLADPAIGKEEKASRQARRAALLESKNKLAQVQASTTKTEEGMQQTVDELRKAYEDALDALLETLRGEQAAVAPAPAAPVPAQG